MEAVIITGYTAKREGVILETNIPARLKPNRMPSKETFVSWDKIGKVLFENYTELEGVASRDSIRNKESGKTTQKRINVELGEKCIQTYEGRKVNCIVTRIEGSTFNATIIGLGIEMVGIPNEKFNPKYCMPDEVNTKEEHEQYLKDIGYDEYIQGLKDFKAKYKGKFILPKAPFEISQMFINHVGEKDFDMMVSDGESFSEEFDSWFKYVCEVAR